MKLTPEQQERLKQSAAALQAFADGKLLEVTRVDWNSWQTSAITDPQALLDAIAGGAIFRPRPEPKVRPWSKPEDVPGPVCWIRSTELPVLEVLIVILSTAGISLFNDDKLQFVPWETFARVAKENSFEHSTDRREWKPCEVPE